jgi:hypothetical protein
VDIGPTPAGQGGERERRTTEQRACPKFGNVKMTFRSCRSFIEKNQNIFIFSNNTCTCAISKMTTKSKNAFFIHNVLIVMPACRVTAPDLNSVIDMKEEANTLVVVP